jgi:hypothetical protein
VPGEHVDNISDIRPLFDMFNEAFKASYNLQREISIDESMLLWKGFSPLQRYIPSKRDRFGFKFFAIACSSTGTQSSQSNTI